MKIINSGNPRTKVHYHVRKNTQNNKLLSITKEIDGKIYLYHKLNKSQIAMKRELLNGLSKLADLNLISKEFFTEASRELLKRYKWTRF